MWLLKLALAFLAAVLLTSLLASITSTQFVIASIEGMSVQGVAVEIPIAKRLMMTLADFGILTTLSLVVAVCFLIGFSVAAACLRFIGGRPSTWYILAGAAGLICTFLILAAVLQVSPVAGARTYLGLAMQGIAGACGGWLFAQLTNLPRASHA